MSIITLLTDFGTDDEYVGVMKGAILSVNPSAAIVDITHEVDPQDLVQAAYLIRSYPGYFPPGTIHLVIVDPGVGSDRPIVAVERQGHCFLSPDNGILTLLVKEGSVDRSVTVDNERYFIKPVSRTFHGRDIFAPVGAHLSLGVDLKQLGKSVDPGSLCVLDIEEASVDDSGDLAGNVISIDRFGNLITNIHRETIARFSETRGDEPLSIQVCGERITGLASSYSNGRPRELLAIIGSRGYLEIAVNSGAARQLLKAEKGASVRLLR